MGHNHSHDHAPANFNTAFAVGVGLNTIYILVEAGYGIAVNSLALLADAGHNLSDVLGLLLAWAAHYLMKLKPTQRRTYGWRSSSILAALLNALLLLVAIGGIVWEAVGRFSEPAEIAGTTVMVVAGIGVIINTITALLFFKGRENDLNIRGAFLHMAADAGVSVAVVFGGLGIYLYGWLWLDPVLSILIAVVIFWGTWGLLKESVNLALQAVPSGIDPAAVHEYLATRDGVTEVHDLHIWAMSTTETALTAHLVMPDISPHGTDNFLHEICHELHDQFKIEHATLQIEQGTTECHLASRDVV